MLNHKIIILLIIVLSLLLSVICIFIIKKTSTSLITTPNDTLTNTSSLSRSELNLLHVNNPFKDKTYHLSLIEGCNSPNIHKFEKLKIIHNDEQKSITIKFYKRDSILAWAYVEALLYINVGATVSLYFENSLISSLEYPVNDNYELLARERFLNEISSSTKTVHRLKLLYITNSIYYSFDCSSDYKYAKQMCITVDHSRVLNGENYKKEISRWDLILAGELSDNNTDLEE